MYRKELLSIIEKLPSAKILVVGDIIVDQYLEGEVDRISPEAPVPIVNLKTGDKDLRLGGAANVFNNLVSLGGKEIYLCGIIDPTDSAGKFLVNYLEEKHFETNGLIVEDSRPTTVKTRILSRGQQIIRLDKEEINDVNENTKKQIFGYIEGKINNIDSIIIADYEKGLLTSDLIEDITKISNNNKLLLAVDPKFKNFRFYENCTIITPNRKEASLFYGLELKSKEEILETAAFIKKVLKCEEVLIKLSEKGMLFYSNEDNFYMPEAKAKNVYDVTGAGDTVIAALIMARVSGSSWKQSVDLANYAAGIVVHERGTVTVNKENLKEFINM